MTKRSGIRDVDSRFPAVVTSRVCLSWREDSGNEVSKSGLVYRPRLVVPFLRQPSRGGLFLGAARARPPTSPFRSAISFLSFSSSFPSPFLLPSYHRSTATLLGPLILPLPLSLSFLTDVLPTTYTKSPCDSFIASLRNPRKLIRRDEIVIKAYWLRAIRGIPFCAATPPRRCLIIIISRCRRG